MAKWYAYVVYQEKLLQPPFMGIFVGATTADHPQLPPGAQMLGGVRNTRAQALTEAMDYLSFEKTAENEHI